MPSAFLLIQIALSLPDIWHYFRKTRISRRIRKAVSIGTALNICGQVGALAYRAQDAEPAIARATLLLAAIVIPLMLNIAAIIWRHPVND